MPNRGSSSDANFTAHNRLSFLLAARSARARGNPRGGLQSAKERLVSVCFGERNALLERRCAIKSQSEVNLPGNLNYAGTCLAGTDLVHAKNLAEIWTVKVSVGRGELSVVEKVKELKSQLDILTFSG